MLRVRPRLLPRRARDEAGVVLPTRVVVASISFVAMSGLAYIATQPDDVRQKATPAASTPSAAPTTPAPAPKPKPKPKPKPQVKRAAVYVEVYNNSNISGLAGTFADRAADVGWNVVGSDNWYGTIAASTVYFPPQLEDAAKLLAKDVGVSRLKPAIDPMRPDRLTLILTGDVS